MIAAVLVASALQLDPAAFAAACMAGGGAPGRVEADSDRMVGRDTVIAAGTMPVTVQVTVNRTSGERVYVRIDNQTSMTVRSGGSVIASGRRIVLGSNENEAFDYCLRVHPT